MGRTARAGNQGTSIVFLERNQTNFFNRMLNNIASDYLKKMTEIKVKKTDLSDLEEPFKESLIKLKAEFTDKK